MKAETNCQPVKTLCTDNPDHTYGAGAGYGITPCVVKTMYTHTKTNPHGFYGPLNLPTDADGQPILPKYPGQATFIYCRDRFLSRPSYFIKNYGPQPIVKTDGISVPFTRSGETNTCCGGTGMVHQYFKINKNRWEYYY